MMAAVAMLAMGSCKPKDHDDDDKRLMGYFTIDGNVNDGYKLYQDGGGIVIPFTSSIKQLAGTNGFGSNERAYLSINYFKSKLMEKDGGVIITQAEVVEGRYLPTSDPLTLAEANGLKVTDKDSVKAVYFINGAWAYRGFLNTNINLNLYRDVNGLVAPATNIVYSPEKIEENKIEFTFVFNPRKPKGLNEEVNVDYDCSFPLYKIKDQIPGKDSVQITVNAEGAKPFSLKISRQNLDKGNYVPYSL